MNSSLVVVTPAYNEEKYISYCVESVAKQTFPVSLHMIVDDKSTDGTKETIEGLMRVHPHVRVVPSRLSREGTRKKGRPLKVVAVGVKEATKTVPNWSYLLCMDADIRIPPTYCSFIIEKMRGNKRLVLSGSNFLVTPAKTEKSSETHVRGANMMVARHFFEWFGMERFDNSFGDTLMEMFALAYGWIVKTFNIKVYELRSTTVQERIFPRWNRGIVYYRLGVPLFMLIPVFPGFLRIKIGDLKEVNGWICAKLCNVSRYVKPNEAKIIRNYYFPLFVKRLKHFFLFFFKGLKRFSLLFVKRLKLK